MPDYNASADFSSLIDQTARANAAFVKMIGTEAELVKVTATNKTKQSEYVTAVYRTTKGVATFSGVLVKNLHQLTQQKLALTENTLKQKQLAGATLAAAKAAEAAQKKVAFTRGTIGGRPEGLDPSQVVKYNAEMAKLEANVIKHNVHQRDIGRIWKEVTNGELKTYTGKLAPIQSSMIKLNKLQVNLKNNTKATIKPTNELLFSWKSLERVFIYQTLRRIFTSLVQGIRDGVTASIELEKRISEIQTISQDAQLPFLEWRDSLRGISDEFGLPLLTQVEGAYQAISNQVVKGAEAFDFMSEASKLAIATVSSVDTSVNVLSSVINAYGLNASDAADISAKLFKTVELGRVRLDELSGSLGDMQVLAEQLNIPLSGVLSLITSLTVQGIKMTKASTQIRGILLKLLKPTKEMQEFFREIGAPSGEAALRIYEMAGLFDLLGKRTKGSSTEMAKLFPVVRGLSGILATTGDKLREVEQDFKALETSSESYAKAVEIAMANSGKKLEVELNKVKNIFLTVGDDILQVVSDLTGGFKYLSTVIGVIVVAALAAMTLAAGYAIKTLAALAVAAWAIPGVPVALGIVSAITAVYSLTKLYTNYIKDEEDAQRKSWRNRVKVIKDAAEQSNRIFKESFDTIAKAQEKALALVSAAAYKIAKDHAESNKEMGESIEDFFDIVSDSISEAVNKSEDAIEKLKDEIIDAQQFLKDSATEAEDYLFQLNLGDQDPAEQLEIIKKRMAELNRELAETKDIDAFKDTSKRLFELEKQAEKIQRDTDKNNTKVVEDQKKLAEDQSKTDKEYNKERLKDAEQLRKAKEKIEEKLTKDLKKNAEDRQDLVEEYAAKEKKTQEDRLDLHLAIRSSISEERSLKAGAAADEQGALADYKEARKEADDEHKEKLKENKTAVDALNITAFDRIDIEDRVNDRLEKQKRLIAELIEQKKAEQKAEEERLRILNLQQKTFDATHEKASSFDALKAVTDENRSAESIAKLSADQLSNREKLLKVMKELGYTTEQMAEIEKKTAQDQKDLTNELQILRKREALDALSDSQNELVARQKILETEIAREKVLQAQLSDSERLGALQVDLVNISAEVPIYDKTVAGAQKDTLLNAAKALALFRDIQTPESAKKVQEAFDAANKTLLEIGSRVPVGELLSDIQALQPAVDAQVASGKTLGQLITDTYNKEQSLLGLNTVIEEAAKRVADTQVEQNGRTEDSVQSLIDKTLELLRLYEGQVGITLKGPDSLDITEPMLFAKGGMIHGSDTVPAMLTPGEFVINAKASKRFYSQLVAMNSGARGFASGGPVQNISVGDINVNMPAATSPDYDVARLGKLLQRGIRRGTVKI